MSKRRANLPDLFDWADAQPAPAVPPAPAADLKTEVSDAASKIGCSDPIDFLARREHLGRWILRGERIIEQYEASIFREVGLLPPAPILAFAPRPPPTADPGGDDAPARRAG